MENEKKTQEFVCDENPEIKDSAAAQRIKALGEDKINKHESQYIGKKVSWLENLWYQHKWHAGIIIFFAVAAITIVVQMLTHVTPDAYLLYTGPTAIVGNRFECFEEALSYVLEDANDDGKIEITMADNTFLNDKQIKEKLKLQDNGYFDYGANAAAYDRFRTVIAAGEHMLCFLDPGIHAEYAQVDAFVPLSEIFGDDIPDSHYGDYGIRLGDTEFYDYFKDIHYIPADTVLSVRVLPEDANEKKQESHAYHLELFKKIVNFDPETIESK